MLAIVALLAFPRLDYTAPFPIARDGSAYVEHDPTSPELLIVDGRTGESKRRLVGCKFKPATVLFSPDGAKIAASSTLGEVCLWSARSGDLIFRAVDADSGRGVRWLTLTFSPDSRTLAVGNLSSAPRPQGASSKPIASAWDTATGKKRLEMRVSGPFDIYRMCFVNEGRTLRVLGTSIIDFDLKTGRRQGADWLRRFSALSDDGSLAYDESTPGWISVWNVRSRKRIMHAESKSPLPIDKAIFSPDNQSIALLRNRTTTYADTGMTMTRVELWSCPGGKLRWTSPEGYSSGILCFSPDGQNLLLPNLEVRGVRAGELVHTFKSPARPALGRRGKWIALPEPAP